MKPKDLNTYINDKLSEGDGLRYQDEYWNDMNRLLEANMPVAKPVTTAAGNAPQATAAGVKVSYLLSAFAAAAAGVAIYIQLSHAPQPGSSPATQPTANNNTSVLQQRPSPEQQAVGSSGSPVAAITPVPAENNLLPANDHNGSSLPPDQTITHPRAASEPPAENVLTPSVVSASPGHSSNTNLMAVTDAPGAAMEAVSDENNTKNVTELILIDPLNITPKITETGMDRVVPPARPTRKRLIKHIDVLPFAGMIAETGEQQYSSGNMVYTHPAQSHFTYGVNIECATKHFSVRTGIGSATTTLRSSVTTGEDRYDVDTSYIIVDPNYGTTPSGKPIALIKRQIDSSYVSTDYTTTTGNTVYQYITIPLTLQYKYAYKRFTAMMEGGVLHQLLISQEGNAPTASDERMVMPAYSFQLTAGSSIRYALTAKWAVGVQYNYNLNPSGANLHFLNNAHVGILTISHSIH